MDQIHFTVEINPGLPHILDEAVIAVGDFAPSDKVLVYRHQQDPDVGNSALQSFYQDLVLGRPLPAKLVARGIEDIDEAMMLALFLDRGLAIHPATAGLVFSCDLARFGPSGMAHVDRDLARFISFARGYLGGPEGRGDRLRAIVEWLGNYIREGVLPTLPPEGSPPRILDVGTNGFVVAETSDDMVEGWTELYRQGYLRGVLFGARSENGRFQALAARKSPFVGLDLARTASVLNDAELAMGELPGWIAQDLWLWSPQEGTLLLPSDILAVLVRV